MTSILSGGNSISLSQATGTFSGGVVIQNTATNGLQIYNTADQTTNYERLELLYSGNIAYVRSTSGGSGVSRALALVGGVGPAELDIGTSAQPYIFNAVTSNSASFKGIQYSSTSNATSGTIVNGISLNPTYNQVSGNATNTDFKIIRVETALGSGTQNLIQCFAGTTGVTEEWTVNNKGKQTVYAGIATAGIGSPAVYAAGRGTALVGASASVSSYTVGTSDGSFRVSANVNVVTSTTHTFTVTCAYTDETNVARTLTLGFTQLAGSTIVTAITNVTGAGPYESISYHIRCKASTAITFATTGTFASVNYNAEGIAVQLA